MILMVLFVFGLSGCGGGGSSSNDTARDNPASVAFERVQPSSGWDNDVRPGSPLETSDAHSFVVRSDAQWRSVWRHFTERVESNGKVSVPDQPTIDFTRFMLVGVSILADGGCNTQFEITQVLETESRISVRYKWKPLDSAATCLAVVAPKLNTDFVKIQASAKPVDFVYDEDRTYPVENGKTITELPFELIQNANDVGTTVPDRKTYVADTEEKWQSIWSQFAPTSTEAVGIPRVDFAFAKVVGVTFVAPSGCHGISINRVVEDDKRVVVEFEETYSSDSTCLQSEVHLKKFVKIKPSSKPIQFRGMLPSGTVPDVLVEGEGEWHDYHMGLLTD